MLAQSARTNLLTFDAACADLLGVPLTFMHPQPEALEGIGVAIGGIIQGFRTFVPTLLVGEESVFGAPVTFSTGGGLLDALGGETVEGDTLSEWIDVTVTTPIGATTTRRTMFDRIGEEARAAADVDLAAVAAIELVDTGDPELSFLPLAGLWALSVVAGSMPERLAVRVQPPAGSADDILPALHAYHFARDVQAPRIPELSGVRLYYDAPNLTAFTTRPTTVEGAGGSADIGIDLIHSSIAVATIATETTVHPLVAAGSLAHAVEQAMFEAAGFAPVELPILATSGVARVFEAARNEGIDVVVLQPGDAEATIPEMDTGPGRLVQEALDAGLVVILPERTVELGGRQRIGWWIVDPITGATRDQMDDGGGSVMGEYAFELKFALCALAFAELGALLGMAVSESSERLALAAAFGAELPATAAVFACGG